MNITWTDYMNGRKDNSARYKECSQQFREAFEQQRINITRVFEARSPEVIACLGAGILNDIPYEQFVHSGATIHLVDWISDSIDSGLDFSIISMDENSEASCTYCDPAIDCPGEYCCHYNAPASGDTKVCKAYKPSEDDPVRCASYKRAVKPFVKYEDVTGGYASAFGRQLGSVIDVARSWKQAITQSIDLAERITNHHSTIDIDDNSVQFVTSSMVVSQFEQEPYDFFSYRAVETLGKPRQREQERLMPAVVKLRDTLLSNQIEGHCREIKRILSSDGVCYMSFELFHYHSASGQWFSAPGMAGVLEIIGRWFTFEFDIIRPDEALVSFQRDEEPSLVGCYVLKAREE